MENGLNLKQNLPRDTETKPMKQKKKTAFEKNLEFINTNNEKFNRGEVSHTFGINQFSDMTSEEFKQTLLTLSPPSTTEPVSLQSSPMLKATAIPSSVDWRNISGYVNPVRDQGYCGSCWAFSAIASLESQHKRYTGRTVYLSEQNLVDCVYGSDGCNGGWMATAWDYIYRNRGVNTRASYLYTASYSGSCFYKSRYVGSRDNGTNYVTNGAASESLLAHAVATYGPVSVAMDATYFQYYSSGIYTDSRCTTSVNHAVNVVGYTPDYFIVRNSWGAAWGEGGYIRVKRGSNLCGISSYVSYPKWSK